MFTPMSRLIVLCGLLLGGAAMAQPASPTPSAPALPAVGDRLTPLGPPGWPALQWLYDSPQAAEAAGKIVVHWFCAPRVDACRDDLARIITLKETSTRVYVIAYINGDRRDAQRLDPIRGSEGVGRGTVAYGRQLATMFKRLGITSPTTIVASPEYRVEQVTTGAAPGALDARDAKVRALAAAIRDYVAISDGPGQVAAGQSFELALTIKLATWLSPGTKPAVFQLRAPKDLRCDKTTLRGRELKVSGRTLTAAVHCKGPPGSYQVRGEIDFSYTTATGATGLGSDGASWKFEIK